MIEAWLLADEAAIQKVCGRGRTINNPETLQDPKTELRHLLAPNQYTSTVAESIAAEANVDIIAKRCSSFRKLRDCLAEGSHARRKPGRAAGGGKTKARRRKSR
jgi:hypothetical protein